MKINHFLHNIIKSKHPYFQLPNSFIEFCETDLSDDISPWWFLHKEEGVFEAWLEEISNQYPSRKLVPFAKINYSDDIACFDASVNSNDPIVHYVHSYASPGWEDRGSVKNFDEWLKLALKDSEIYKNDID